MLLKLSVILTVLAIVFLAVYIVTVKRRSENSKKALRKVCGVFATICSVAAAVIFVVYCKSENISFFNRTKTYNPVESYKQSLEKDGAEAAYIGLPDAIFSVGCDIYFKNGKNDMFVLENEAQEDGSEKTVAKTLSNNTVFIDGKNTLCATITDNNELILDGYLLYSQFESDKIEFNNKVIAKNVLHCDMTDNSLLYITENGDMYAIGFNEYGQLGDTTAKNKSDNTFVLPNMSSCAISDTHSMTIDNFGTLCAVGDNSYSQLGNKTAVSTTEPVTIMRGVKNAKVGNYFSLVLAVNGELFTAGRNDKGQLGNNGEDFKAELIPIMTGVKKIDVSGDTCAALTFDGDLFVWGDNTSHKGGSKDGEILLAPVKIMSNVIDFTLCGDAVAVINSDRDILKSNAEGVFEAKISFGATVPDAYKQDAQVLQSTGTDAM